MSNPLVNKGFNIFNNLLESETKKIMEYFENMSIDQLNEINNQSIVPKIVVIGSESSGKSSLLENITKCSIFPIDEKLCTNRPIIVNFSPVYEGEEPGYYYNDGESEYETDAESLGYNISEIMKESQDEISEIPITISIKDYNLQPCEIIDLPGLVAVPEQKKEITEKIVKKYLQNPDILILCVIPATCQETSYLPLQLIEKFNRKSNTIATITMCDLIEKMIDNSLLKKIRYFKEQEYLDVVAIINKEKKTQNDENEEKCNSLTQNDKIESTVFKNYCKKCTNLNSYKNELGIEKLLKKINEYYDNNIRQTLVPTVIELIQEENVKLHNEVLKFGPSLEELDIDSVTADILKHLSKDVFSANSLHQYVLSNYDGNWSYDVIFNNTKNLSTTSVVNNEVLKIISEKISNIITDFIITKYNSLIAIMISPVNNDGKKLYRYSNFFETLTSDLLKHNDYFTHSIMAVIQSNPLLLFYTKDDFINSLFTTSGFKEMLNFITFLLIKNIINENKNLMIENPEYHDKRTQLENKLIENTNLIEQLKNV